MGKTILVTGSSSGLGKAVAEHFAGRDGWNVAATMRDPDRGGMFSGIRDIGVFEVFELDVTKPETVRATVDEAVAAFGTIDVLFNNVGYGGLMLFEETTDESFRAAFETNFFGHLEVMRAVLPVMRAQRSGFVINVTSLAGLFGIPLQSAYCASKFAMTGVHRGREVGACEHWYRLYGLRGWRDENGFRGPHVRRPGGRDRRLRCVYDADSPGNREGYREVPGERHRPGRRGGLRLQAGTDAAEAVPIPPHP